MIYLDYAASAPPFEECCRLVSQVMGSAWGNPGALHCAGADARKLLQQSRLHLHQPVLQLCYADFRLWQYAPALEKEHY